ncbi:MAG: serine/threonine-protein kinase [Nannocystaceae bacterium]
MGETMPYHGGGGGGRGRGKAVAEPPTGDGGASLATALDETLPNSPGDSDLGEGSKIGRYEVLERVGSGGMGVVYRAHDPELHREVALKLLKAERAVGAAAIKRRKRLLREARAMAQLSHPNVIPVYDVGEYGTGLYVAMEFVEGANARQWLKSVKPPWRRTLGVFRAAGRGLAAAHNAGLVHRDFKPANVLVGDDGRVRVLDFGLARAQLDDAEPELSPRGREEIELGRQWSETLTADGTILGTPVYMAPEQYAGKAADARSDQYSYCIALYEALYGQLPFTARGIKAQARAKHRGELLEAPADSDVPRRLALVLRRGLSPRPEDRYPSMPDLLRELRAVHEERTAPPPAWRSWAAVFGVASVAVGTMLVASLRRPNPAVVPAAATCPSTAEALAGAWDEPRRHQLRAAFEDSTVAGAADRFAEVAARLDAYAITWGALHDQACAQREGVDRAARLARARLACLERKRSDLVALVDVLQEPTAVVIHRSVAAAHALPGLEECEDEMGLLLLAARDAPGHERTVQLREGIGRARALRATGRPDAAQREIDAVIEQAGAEDLRPVTGLALLERAQLRRGADDLAAAEHDLRAAYFNAVADRRARVAATAAIGLVDVLAARGRTEEALAWSEHARAQLDAVAQASSLDAALQQALAQVGAAEREAPTKPTEP